MVPAVAGQTYDAASVTEAFLEGVTAQGEDRTVRVAGSETEADFTDDDAARLGPAAQSLSEAGRRGALGRMTVERADGEQILGGGSTPLREALDAAGFVSTPRGLRLRA